MSDICGAGISSLKLSRNLSAFWIGNILMRAIFFNFSSLSLNFDAGLSPSDRSSDLYPCFHSYCDQDSLPYSVTIYKKKKFLLVCW
jgi:hypothetical protein